MAKSTTAQTIAYYNQNAASFSDDTLEVKFSRLQDQFASYLPKGARVLDLGCGSGRDARVFKSRGYQVVAVDGSQQMCEIASRVIGQPVACALFDEYEPQGSFDGIWACSSLLHVPLEDLPGLLSKYADHLKPGGVFYLSFKYGSSQGMRGGRWFTNLDEQALRDLLAQVPQLQADRVLVTQDVRPGRADEQWLNAFCKRV